MAQGAHRRGHLDRGDAGTANSAVTSSRLELSDSSSECEPTFCHESGSMRGAQAAFLTKSAPPSATQTSAYFIDSRNTEWVAFRARCSYRAYGCCWDAKLPRCRLFPLMPTFAAVDIGSNSVRLKIARVVRGRLHTLHEDREVTRLGESVFANGSLDPQAMSLTMQRAATFSSRGADTCRRPRPRRGYRSAPRIRVIAAPSSTGCAPPRAGRRGSHLPGSKKDA